MYRGDYKRGGFGTPGRKPYEAEKGLFVNGCWQCECNPRLHGLHLQTKKAGPNHGKWFYTCQKPRDAADKCKFFLWETDAQPREQSALLNNTRTEAHPTNTTTRTPSKPTPSRPTPSRSTPAGPQRFISPPPPYSVETEPESARKRRRPTTDDEETEDEGDEFGVNRSNSAFDLLQEMMDAETPRKAAKTGDFTTPRRKLPWQTAGNGMPTLQTEGRLSSEPFSSRLAKMSGSSVTPSRSQMSGASTQTIAASVSPFETPTPSRFKDAVAHSDNSLVDEVFSFLSDENVHISSSASTGLKSILGKHARRAEGNSKAKEVLRLRIKAEEAKNMELSLRNNTLQAELEASRATVDHLQWEKEQGSDG